MRCWGANTVTLEGRDKHGHRASHVEKDVV
jgi:hypothetical protein